MKVLHLALKSGICLLNFLTQCILEKELNTLKETSSNVNPVQGLQLFLKALHKS